MPAPPGLAPAPAPCAPYSRADPRSAAHPGPGGGGRGWGGRERHDPGGGEFGGSSCRRPLLPAGCAEIRGPERAAPAGPQFPLPGSQTSAPQLRR